MKKVWIRLARNPNNYACVLGLIWALLANRWNLKMPGVVEGSILIMSKAGSGVAMFNMARVIVDRDTGKSRGFAFVTYGSVDDASAAIQALDQQELHGHRIRVDYANDRARGYGWWGLQRWWL